MYEMKVQSNQYDSSFLTGMESAQTEVDHFGMLMEDVPAAPHAADKYGEVSWETYNQEVEKGQQVDGIIIPPGKTKHEITFTREVRECVSEQLMTAERSVAFKWYDKYQFGATRGFLRMSMGQPDLSEGVRWLMAIRVRGFPKVNERWQCITRSGKVPDFDQDVCPLRKKGVTAGFEWGHLMVECGNEAVKEARKLCLEKPIAHLRRVLRHEHELRGEFRNVTGIDSQNGLSGVVAIYLAGGTVSGARDYAFHTGYGQIDQVVDDLGQFGFIYGAQFLQMVAPRYMTALSLNAYGARVHQH
ncbi:hypothetical protein OF83DRAFT_1089799 [Amylostereum chailletii]|nr:hypothetical protein OF83DRAFT_1089799 [Amylostereum chailletii]